jgi:hypothetical protein
MIFDPIKEIFLLFENFPKINNKLNNSECLRLINLIKNSNLSVRDIFNRDDLSGDIEEDKLHELMNKNKITS